MVFENAEYIMFRRLVRSGEVEPIKTYLGKIFIEYNRHLTWK